RTGRLEAANAGREWLSACLCQTGEARPLALAPAERPGPFSRVLQAVVSWRRVDGSEDRVAEGQRQENERAAGEGGGGGPLAVEQEHPEGAEDRFHERDQARLGASDAAQADPEKRVWHRNLQAAHR